MLTLGVCKSRKSGGFTLLELLIVLVIMGVLVSLAVPLFQPLVEKNRAKEALASLREARSSLGRLFAQENTYVGAAFSAVDCGAAGTHCTDFNPNDVGSQNRIFEYSLSELGLTEYLITATRINGTVGGEPLAPGSGPHTIAVDETGKITKTGVYK